MIATETIPSLMHALPVVLSPTQTLAQALFLFEENDFRHLPVVEAGRVVGMLSEADLKRYDGFITSSFDAFMRRRRLDHGQIRSAMTSPVYCINADAPLSLAIELMLEYRVHALPVLEAGALIGIVTDTDLLTFFHHQLTDL